MSKNLVIVESPAKAKTIKNFLWKDYAVEASMGHICDLSKKNLWIDIENNFEPDYKTAKWKRKIISKLKKAQKDKKVRLATDEDREWEAIARHLTRKLDLDPDETPRIAFHEITKEAIQNAIKNPRKLDFDLIDAQQWRRILDRLVGFKVSPILWKHIKRWLSAWRVQSVAVKLIVEKEKERKAFDPKESRKLYSDAKYQKDKLTLNFYKDQEGNKKIKTQKDIQNILQNIGLTEKNFSKGKTKKWHIKLTNKTKNKQIEFKLIDITTRTGTKKPYPPLTTSTLQQSASNVLGRNVKTTMGVAQKLYESGHITYMRTDSTKLSKKALWAASKYIQNEYGKEYHKYRTYSSKSKNIQWAHEAIRPTDIFKTPAKAKLTGQAQKLYDLIWRRTLATQMANAKTKNTTYTFNPYHLKDQKTIKQKWRAKWQIITFDGFLKVLDKSSKKTDDILPKIKKWTDIKSQKVTAKQKFSKPPARYSEATLVKTLKKKWIGRPSTYAPTIDKIQQRWYVEKEGRYLKPKEIAFILVEFLEKHFPKLMDYKFTASMEDNLDKIAQWDLEYQKMLENFRDKFEPKVQKAMEQKPEKLLVGKDCPECGGDLVYKFSKTGKFIGCSNYPECRYTERTKESKDKLQRLKEKYEWDDCPAGWKIVVKMWKYGPFLASSKYPEVKRIKPIPDEKKIYLQDKYGWKPCDKCEDGTMDVKKKRRWRSKNPYFLGCSNYPKCKNIENIKLTDDDKDKLQQIENSD